MPKITYTVEDIEKQVWNFERVKIHIPNRSLTFNKKWSEVFRNALPDNKVVIGFKDRYVIFCTACRNN